MALSLALGLALGMLAAPPAAQAQGKPAHYADGVVLVGFKPGTPEAARASARQSVGALRASPLSRLAVDAEKMVLPHGRSVPAAIKVLLRNPNVRVAEPDYLLAKVATSNDPYYVGSSLWGMYGNATNPANPFGSQAGEAWAAGYTGSSTVYVGVIDEGIQTTHPDLAANIWVNPAETPGNGMDDDGNGYADDVNGWDFYHNDASVYDAGEDDHGTHVAGTIGGVGGNGEGVAGVNWQVKLISAKFLGPGGGQTSAAIAAVDYINDLKDRHQLNIVATSNSWGGGGFSQLLLDAINRGGDRGILFVAAAGNSSTNIDGGAFYPASYQCTTPTRNWDCLISVASITSGGALSSFSNFGATTVDIGAPGSDIWSTVPVNSYAAYSGTSMATPHVSGAVALCASMSPSLAARDRRFAVLNSAAPTPALAGATVTGGRLDIGALASACRPATGPVTGVPQSLGATGSSPTTIDVTWTDGSSGETYYEIQRGDASCQGFATVATVPAGPTFFRATGLSASTTYCFRVRAANDHPSTTAWSGTATATTKAVPPPYQCSATAYEWLDTSSGQSLALGDDAQAAVTMPFAWPFYGTPGDQMRISSNGFVRLDGGAATAFSNASIPSASEPNGFIAPFWDDLNPGAGGVVRVATTGVRPARRYVVSWEGVPHFALSGSAVSFQLVFEEATGQVVMNYADVVAGGASYDGGASATVGIEDPTGLYGTLLSYNRASLSSGSSYRCAPQSVNQPPAAPSGLTAAAVAPNRVDLAWNDVSGEAGYAVERAVGAGPFTQVGTALADTVAFTDTAVAEQTAYSYRVRALNAAGWSAYSNTATVTTPGIKPAPPTNVSASASGMTITITWTDASTNETAFEIGQETLSRNKTWSAVSVVGSVLANATTFSRSPGAGTYRYRVRAVNRTVSSDWSGASAQVTVAGGKK